MVSIEVPFTNDVVVSSPKNAKKTKNRAQHTTTTRSTIHRQDRCTKTNLVHINKATHNKTWMNKARAKWLEKKEAKKTKHDLITHSGGCPESRDAPSPYLLSLLGGRSPSQSKLGRSRLPFPSPFLLMSCLKLHDSPSETSPFAIFASTSVISFSSDGSSTRSSVVSGIGVSQLGHLIQVPL